MVSMKSIAVITADMVNSTQFGRTETTLWLNQLMDDLRMNSDFDWIFPPEIYRGDSFQCVLKSPEMALQMAVFARATMRAHHENTDLRVSIGIGTADALTDRVGTSDGEAFRFSGHLADHIKKQKARIGIVLAQPSEPLTASLDLLETIIGNWTTAQSEVAAGLLTGESITKISERLAVSQSAISQRVSASQWWAVHRFLETFPKNLALYTT